MKFSKQRSFSIFTIFILLLSLILPSSVFAYDIEGDPNNPKLTIYKIEQEQEGEKEPGSGLPDQVFEGEPLEGVEFTFTQTHQYDPNTDEWIEVSGEPFTRVTDSEGKIVLDNIDMGRYRVQETDGPPHVNLNTNEYFVDLPMTSEDGTTLNYDVHIYPKNETIRGAVELFKIDGEAEGKVGLEGAKFALYKVGENDTDELIEENLTTDANGYIRVNGLAYGDYYFKETEAPEDYVMFGEKISFSITKSGSVDEIGNRDGVVVELEVTNHIPPAIEKTVEGSTDTHRTNRETDFTFNLKIILPEDIEEYEEFIVTDELDDRLTYAGHWDVEGIAEELLDFSENGQTLTWEVKEDAFVELEGVEYFTINFTAQIKEGTEIEEIPNEARIDFTNGSGQDGDKPSNKVYVEPTEGGLKIVKQDGDTEERLPGAEFALLDEDGNEVKTGTTNENGEIVWDGLDYGEYEVVETKAPEGYRLLTQPIHVTVEDSDEELITLEIDNFKQGWDLPTTGGIGTMLFTIVGITIMSVAVYMYTRRRKAQTT